jgi:hypothetical protein
MGSYMSEFITVDNSNIISSGTSVVTVKDMIKISVDDRLVASMDGKFDFDEIDQEYHQYMINLISGMSRSVYYSSTQITKSITSEVTRKVSFWKKLLNTRKK